MTGHPTGHVLSDTNTSTFYLNCKFWEAIYRIQILFKEAFTASGLFLGDGRREICILRNFIFYLGICLSPGFYSCTCVCHLTADHAVLLNVAQQCSSDIWMQKHLPWQGLVPGTFILFWEQVESPARLKISAVTHQIIHTVWDFAFNHGVGLTVSILPLHPSYSVLTLWPPNVPVQICRASLKMDGNPWQKELLCWGLPPSTIPGTTACTICFTCEAEHKTRSFFKSLKNPTAN